MIEISKEDLEFFIEIAENYLLEIEGSWGLKDYQIEEFIKQMQKKLEESK